MHSDPASEGPVNLLEAVEARRRILAIADKLNARDDNALSYAAENLVTGRPAFWSPATYHSAARSYLRLYANIEGGILLGIGAINFDFGRDHHDYGSVSFLDELMPLNDAAVEDLIAAYRRAGTFRSVDELHRRTAKVEGSYLPTVQARRAPAETMGA